MTDSSRHPADEPLYLVNTFKDEMLTPCEMTRSEVLALDPTEVDFFRDTVFGRISIRLPDGTYRRHMVNIPGLGSENGIPFLEDVMWALGEFLTIKQIRNGLDSLWMPGPRAAQVRRVRSALGDTAELQRYIIVKSPPWSVAWNIARSWTIVERNGRARSACE